MRRRYESPLRAAQVEATRERLLEATYAVLAEDPAGVAALTFQRVADRARVSLPTVYRHFGDQDALLAAFVAWIRPRIGLDPAQLFSLPPDAIAALPEESFPRFEAHGDVLRALIDSREANRVRAAAVTDRAERAAAALREHAPTWDEEELKAAAGAIAVLLAPPTWRWLRDTWGLDAAATRAAASWALGVLLAELKEERNDRPRIPQ
jgi:AcrR family transcriptional regulator